MKKFLLSIVLVAFAVAVQAGDGQCTKGGCCGGDKAKVEKKETTSKGTTASPKSTEQAKR
jgi:hypothetical protein